MMDNKKRVNNIIRIPASLNGSFFRYWLKFLAPFHNLTERELDAAASFIKHKYELGKAIKDERLLDEILMNEDTKRKIRKECNFTGPHFQVIMGKLRKANFIVDGKINPKFMPKNIEDNAKSFQLLLYFDLDG
ncbi:MAG: hypothetical protein IJU02_07265 [Lachnospiraceae bacterium]|nr:hypothetical protein [Lachnospiraceae bacterium]